ncbi:MAG TPA: DNA-formamidopyrimidine glycosylase family protein, partial [Pirellulales bacterium]|nr:DNA-formamidopyrimidine glycosylase family protein [Pirellulales bacterium]
MRRGIAAIVGQTVSDVQRPNCKLRPIGVRPAWPTLRRRVVGRKIEATQRIGKRVVLVLDSGDRLV